MPSELTVSERQPRNYPQETEANEKYSFRSRSELVKRPQRLSSMRGVQVILRLVPAESSSCGGNEQRIETMLALPIQFYYQSGRIDQDLENDLGKGERKGEREWKATEEGELWKKSSKSRRKL